MDADHANDPDRRRSRSGYIIRANGNVIDFGTGLQPKTASSTPVAEYVALASLTKQLIFIYQLLQTIGVDVIHPMKIFEDNKGAVCISKNAASQKKTRAIEIRYHFVRDYQQDGLIEVIQCPTVDMQADMMTKTLRRPEHVRQTARTMSECEPLPTQSI